MKIAVSFCVFGLVAMILLSTCSKDFVEPVTLNPGGVPPDGDTTVTDEEIWGIMNAMSAMTLSMNELKSHSERLKFCEWLRTIPQVNKVYLDDPTIICLLRNGQKLFVAKTPPPPDPNGGRQNIVYEIKEDLENSSHFGRVEDIPGSTKVMLFNALPASYENSTKAIAQLFESAKRKFNNSAFNVVVKPATITELRNVSNAGIFYISAHGVSGRYPNGNNKDSVDFTAITTLETPTTALNKAYAGYIKRDEVHRIQDTKGEWSYYITSAFVKKYMDFAQNPLVYIDACETFNAKGDSKAFRDAFIAKQNGTYIGWDGRTESKICLNVSWLIFDRMLGTNERHPVVPMLVEPERPFDLESVMNDLPNYYLITPNDSSNIHFDTRQIDEVIITPSIEYMDIDEYTSTLLLHGFFGQKAGNISVGGVKVAPVAWSPDVIACVIPKSGDGSFGDVYVTVNGINSNVVPITTYDLKINFAMNDNGTKIDGYCLLKIRADLHPHRSAIHTTPKRTTYPDMSRAASGYQFAEGSYAYYSISGNKFAQCNLNECMISVYEGPAVTSGTVPYSVLPGSGPSLFALYNWEPDQMAFRVDFLALTTPVTNIHLEETFVCEKTYVIQADTPTSLGFVLPDPEMGFIPRIEIADNYNIRDGSKSKATDRRWGECAITGKYSLGVNWSTTQPKSAPTLETLARKPM